MSAIEIASSGEEVWVEIKGQSWCRVPPNLEWGLEDYFIVRTESGERLILCNMELHHSSAGIVLREKPVIRGAVRDWSYQSNA